MGAPVFISHSSRDKEVAETLCQALEKRGIACWISSRDIGPGQNFQEAIVNAVTGARVMVLVFSSSANNSDEIKKELALASQNRLAVIPTRVEDVMPTAAFKYELATRQWIDIFKNWEQAIGLLSVQIHDIIDQEKPAELAAAAVVAPPRIGPKPNRMPLILGAIAALLIVAGGAFWLSQKQAAAPAAIMAKAPEIGGKWVSSEFQSAYEPNTRETIHFTLEQTGDQLFGTLTLTTADGRGGRKPIHDGHVTGTSVVFDTPLQTTDGNYKEKLSRNDQRRRHRVHPPERHAERGRGREVPGQARIAADVTPTR